MRGLYQLGEAIAFPVYDEVLGCDRQGVIPAGTVLAVLDREGREAEAECGHVHLINLAECEFLCSLPLSVEVE